jgi:hypothetical protein
MGQTVPAPNTLSHTVSANRLHVAYNRIVVNNPTWDVEWFAGMGYERLGWSATVANGGVPTLTGRTAGFGATGGALARWKLSDRWAIDAKVRVTGGGPVSGSRIEAAASYLLTDGLRARLGYARTETEGKLRSSEAYRLIVRTNGPVAALELTF